MCTIIHDDNHYKCHLCDNRSSMNKCSHCPYILCDSCYHKYFVIYRNTRCPHCRFNFHSESDDIVNHLNIIVSDNENVRGILVFNRRRLMSTSLDLMRLGNIHMIKILFIISCPILFILILYGLGMMIMVYLFKSNIHNNISLNLLVGFMAFTVLYIFIIIPLISLFPEKCKKIHIFLTSDPYLTPGR